MIHRIYIFRFLYIGIDSRLQFPDSVPIVIAAYLPRSYGLALRHDLPILRRYLHIRAAPDLSVLLPELIIEIGLHLLGGTELKPLLPDRPLHDLHGGGNVLDSNSAHRGDLHTVNLNAELPPLLPYVSLGERIHLPLQEERIEPIDAIAQHDIVHAVV